MRTSVLSAALVAALSVTAWSPSRAEAQVVIYPTATASPYIYSRYWTPSYNYAYTWTNPYYNTYQSYWGGPYGNYNWTWVTPNYYSGYRAPLWPGWRGGFWRW
jgi:hypothetical protein